MTIDAIEIQWKNQFIFIFLVNNSEVGASIWMEMMNISLAFSMNEFDRWLLISVNERNQKRGWGHHVERSSIWKYAMMATMATIATMAMMATTPMNDGTANVKRYQLHSICARLYSNWIMLHVCDADWIKNGRTSANKLCEEKIEVSIDFNRWNARADHRGHHLWLTNVGFDSASNRTSTSLAVPRQLHRVHVHSSLNCCIARVPMELQRITRCTRTKYIFAFLHSLKRSYNHNSQNRAHKKATKWKQSRPHNT